jgi:predicted transcriptional regulator
MVQEPSRAQGMSSRKTVSISLSEEMIAELDRVRTSEDRSRYEVVDEALRWYFRRVPLETPTPAEAAAIAEGRAAIERGDCVSFEQLLHDLDPDRRQAGAAAT